MIKNILRHMSYKTGPLNPWGPGPFIRPFPDEIIAYKIMKLNKDGTLSSETFCKGEKYNIGDIIYQTNARYGVHAYRTANVAIEIINDKPHEYLIYWEYPFLAVVKVKLFNPFVAGAEKIHYYRRKTRCVNVVAGRAAEILEIITDNRKSRCD